MKRNIFILTVFFPLFLFSAAVLINVPGIIDLANPENFANQDFPNYINDDNTPNNNPITDAGATLGKVLFYDTKLSVDNTVACATCHQQQFAFGDPDVLSTGVNGLTGRHSMRLINARFGNEENFFWDERANSLEEQTTQPIQDHVEMGFSGEAGAPTIDSLINKLNQVDYYPILFENVFGDPTITEDRMQLVIAQFIRSIQSFDSRFDDGLAQTGNEDANFPNFTTQENLGKQLFFTNQNNNGAGCERCHRSPEFDIRGNTNNNGVIGVANDPNGVDLTNTRSPSLRDVVGPTGVENGPFMHDGSLATLLDVVDHYDFIPPTPNLDNRLGGNNGQNLNLTQAEKEALVAFMGTLTGSNVYTDERYSNPFDVNGNLTVLIDCPDADFDGVCDDQDVCIGGNDLLDTNANGLPDDCEPVAVSLKVFLEGAYEEGTGLMSTFLSTNGLLPVNQPFNAAPYFYAGNEVIPQVSVDMVDWVLVEARTAPSALSKVDTQVGILMRDGQIKSPDGVSPLMFDLPMGANCYFVVRHRNHLDIMTAGPSIRSLNIAFDFSLQTSQAFGAEQQKLSTDGTAMMYAGDITQDMVIQSSDFDQWALITAAVNVYSPVDLNLDGFIQTTDYDVWFVNKAKVAPVDLGY